MVRLSNRQYPLLADFINSKRDFMSIEEAQSIDQRPFRSMLIQRWVIYVPGKGFKISKDGIKAWNEFQTTDISRKDPTKPLTKYFTEKQHVKSA